MRVCWMRPSQLHICSSHPHIHLIVVHHVQLLYPDPNWQTISQVSRNLVIGILSSTAFPACAITDQVPYSIAQSIDLVFE